MSLKLDSIKAISELIFVSDPVTKADVIIVPGSSHKQLPLRAVQLYKDGITKNLIFTGSFNPKLNQSESEWYKEIALSQKVPQDSIFVETQAKNTKENAIETNRLIKLKKLPHKKIMIVCKPYHARRLQMTFSKVFKKSKILLHPVTDNRNITKNNWWKNEDKIKEVIGELEKIGRYYLKGDLDLY